MRFAMREKATVSLFGVVVVVGGVFTVAGITDALGLVEGRAIEISRFTIDGGGDTVSAGGGFELSGTIGQPDAGVLDGGEFTLTGGFWFEEPPGDCNSTGDVNLLDYFDFEVCLSGPGGQLVAPSCACFDVDGDRDVDLLDTASFNALMGK